MRNDLGELGLDFDDHRAAVVFAENGKKYEGRNRARQRVLAYRVDGGMLAGVELKACDYLLGIPRRECVYLIELKGHDLPHAIEQLKSTYEQLKARFRRRVVNGRIVLSRVSRPDTRASATLQFARDLAGTGGTLKYRSVLMREDF